MVVTTNEVTTITATAIAQTSISEGSTVYDVPQQISLQTSKKLTAISAVQLSYANSGKQVVVPTKVSFKGSVIVVKFSQVLPRQTGFTLHLDNVTATDNSQLERPYDLTFTTSGGPKVVDVSARTTDMVSGSPITITFDQPLLADQVPGNLVSLTADGKNYSLSYSLHGSAITITPHGSYPFCTHLVIAVTNGVKSQYGISGNSGLNFTSRSRCYTTFSIGTSVQGRAITGYRFGTGSSTVLYIAAMHGNESNTSVLLRKWFNVLVANPDRVPANRTIVVIPSINPDGVAANSRRNAHGVDLNRNFPTSDWQTMVTEPDSNGQLTADGGPGPFSEPESQALAAYVQAARPRLVLTYHSRAGVVEANDAADSDALGNRYASLSGYRAIPTYAIGNTFDYSTSGAFEDWANQKLGIPVLVVELTSKTNDEFSRNQSAMWAMTKI